MTKARALALLELLAAHRGLVCAVGAGGKKTTLYRLVEAHLAAGSSRIGLTCTVAMARPPRALGKPLIAENRSRLANSVRQLARRLTGAESAEAQPVRQVPAKLATRLTGLF